MAPANPKTWTHEPSIIKEDELREMAVLLGKGFRVHHSDAVGGISLSCNPNPQKYMVMQYHSVENGLRLPLHGLLRNLCRHFGFAPGQLTANAHKYVASYILRCCALDRTPTLDEFLILFSIGGSFPFYTLYPHSHAPTFERVEFKNDKWSQRYFVIEFPAQSPLDLPGVVLRSSISRTKFATAHSAEEVYNVLRDKGGLIPHHSLQDARSKSPPAVESGPAGCSSGVQTLGNFTALAIRKPTVALEAVPISAIPGLRRPTPSQKRPREGVTDDDFLPKKNELPDQAPLKKPAVQPQPEVNNTSPQIATAPQEVEEEVEGQKEPKISSATEEVDVQTEAETPPSKENEVEEQRDTGAPPKREREPEKQSEPEGQCSTATPPALNVPIRQKMKESLKEPTIPQARPDLLALNALYSMEQALQEENARLKKNGSMELAAERSKVKSLQEQIAAYQRGTQDLEMQFDRLRAQISTLESKASASEDKVGSLKAELVERESRISELESSLQEAKYEGSRLNELALKHMEARLVTLEKLGKERQTASEL
ncbi:unnamed protein product [Cuscuta campestris]|uniref:Uncharacterized protein n=1 Tax=Cuscuta campestris TaxID=132261 RepID=A0A484M475_9ASTE|nr:unnamed protein product [Cuscuta campestris]